MITGGASGIGRAMAEAFAGESTRVVLADIEPGALDEVLTHAEFVPRVQERMEDILEGRNPTAAQPIG